MAEPLSYNEFRGLVEELQKENKTLKELLESQGITTDKYESLENEQEDEQLREQLSKNLQRNELITELLRLFNNNRSYEEKFKQIIKQIVFHFNPRRILILEHIKNNTKGKIITQFCTDDLQPLADSYELPLDEIPSFIPSFEKRRILPGFELDYLPKDIKELLGELGFNNAYIFPMYESEVVSGSFIFENLGTGMLDNTEINYLKIISIIVSNLNSQRRYEDKLVAAKEKAEQADRLKSSFLASMSHDIRIPMTSIIGFSDLLADPDLTVGEREEFVELISKSGQDLLILIDNIVDLAKIETGQLIVQKHTHSLYTVLNELFIDFVNDYRLSEVDNLELILDLPQEYKSLEIETDVFRLKQILSNLIDNAIKFTEAGTIHFGISNFYDDKIEFYVKDTGIGIAEETQSIIFERFGKVDRSYTKEYKGTGLGLSISKSLVELLGGDIKLISYPNRGSIFSFTHPVPPSLIDSLKNKTKNNKIKKANWEDKRVLVVEDIEPNYKIIEFILSSTGINIDWLKDGLQAVKSIESGNRPDVILMDIRMPVLNGIEASKRILEIYDIPIIIQTAYNLDFEKKLSFDIGCKGYISKPINSDELFRQMDAILSGHKIQNK